MATPDEAREEIETRALCGEDRGQRAAQGGDDVAAREPAAVGDAEFDQQSRVDERRRGREGGGAGEHAGLAGDDACEAVAGKGRAGDVAVACQVFGERGERGGAGRLRVTARTHERSALPVAPSAR